MKIKIKPGKRLSEIQKEFQDAFPMLKLEFFKNPHRPNEASAKKDILNAGLTVAEVTKGEGEISITGKMKVAEVEQSFKKDVGLYAQVFRKSGEVWLLTSTTDDLTLEQQQVAAKESEQQYNYNMHNFADKRD